MLAKRALAAVSLTAIILAGAPVAAQPTARAAAVPKIAYTERVLKNGLRVLAVRDTSTPNVAVSVWYDVGSKHDPEGRSGFAHLFEHILSRKTVNMPYNMINRLTEDVGGVRNASTWYDRTNYYEIVPAQYLETMIWTHAERMARPVVDKEVFETERNVVKEELRQRVLAPPYGRLFSFVVGENSYDTLPHRRPTIGSIADLESATLEDARAFHQAYYGPDTATLIVAGNFDEAQLGQLVDRYFGAIPKRSKQIPLKISGSEPKRSGERRVSATGPNVPLPVVGASYRVPAAAHRDRAAIEVMEAILSTGENSRFHNALVRGGLATQAGTMLNWTREAGYFVPFAMISAGQDADKAAAAMDLTMAGLRNGDVKDAELTEAKNELLAAALEERETFSGRAFELGEALVRTGDPKAADARLAAIQAVTAADVTRVAKTYLDPATRVAIRYAAGDGNPASWTNPIPLPKFRSVPAATGAANQLASEDARQAPPGPSVAPAVTPPKIAETRLSNGINVVAARTGMVPLATLSVIIRGGAATDPRAKAGLATFAADLATKGTATRSAEDIAATMESLGASLSAGAGSDGTTLSVTAPAANLAAASEILADIVSNANYPEAEFQRERKRALDGLQVAMKDPGALAQMVAQPILYGDAPYGTLTGGTVKSLSALTRADLVAHRQAYWRPGHAAIVVTGGIDPQEATALAGRLFGSWAASGPAPVLPTDLAGKANAPRTVVVDLPNAGQAAVVAAVPALSRSDPQYFNLLLANSVLGVGSNGRLFTEVRSKRALSYGAYSNLPARAGTSVLFASSQTKNESAADVAKIFLDEFQRLGAEPLTDDALTKRKAFLGGAYQRQLETGRGFNNVVSGLIQQGLQPREAMEYAQRLAAVTPEAASQIAAQLVTPQRASLVIVGDSAKFIDKLRAIRPDVVVIPADKLDLDAPLRGAQP